MHELRQLSNTALIERTDHAVRSDRRSNVVVIEHLAEVLRRKVYRDVGHPSLFDFCVKRGRMSREVAYKRCRLARLALRFPVVLDYLRDGRLTMRALTMLAPHLNHENSAQLLDSARHMTRDQIDELLARLFPKREVKVPESFRKLPSSEPAASPPSPQSTLLEIPDPKPQTAPAIPTAQGGTIHRPTPTPARREQVSAVADNIFKVQFPATRGFKDLYNEVHDLVSHRLPGGSMEDVLTMALESLRDRVLKERFGIGAKARRSRPSIKVRYISKEIAREVYERDGGRCTFVAEDGTRCNARAFLEQDHVVPVAQGGKADSADDVRLLCRAHNQLMAERAGLRRPG